MTELVAYLRSQSPFAQGVFLAAVGFAGVFVVIALFYVSIVILERLFRAKDEANGRED